MGAEHRDLAMVVPGMNFQWRAGPGGTATAEVESVNCGEKGYGRSRGVVLDKG